MHASVLRGRDDSCLTPWCRPIPVPGPGGPPKQRRPSPGRLGYRVRAAARTLPRRRRSISEVLLHALRKCEPIVERRRSHLVEMDAVPGPEIGKTSTCVICAADNQRCQDQNHGVRGTSNPAPERRHVGPMKGFYHENLKILAVDGPYPDPASTALCKCRARSPSRCRSCRQNRSPSCLRTRVRT